MKKFVPNFDIISEQKIGDYGITERLLRPVYNTLVARATPDTVDQFIELSIIPFFSGQWAMERTVISSMMNIQNASILSSLTYLKIFGELEIVRNKFGNSLDGNPAGSSTFLNPEVTPGSFISNWRELYPTLDQEFKNAIDIKPEGRLPGSIILGKYHQDGSYLEPTAAQTASNLWLGFWPQYETFDEYDQEIRDFMNDKLTPYQDTTFKDQLVAEKMSYTNDEYIALTDNAQLNGNDDIPEQAQTFFKSVTVINQDGNEIILEKCGHTFELDFLGTYDENNKFTEGIE